MFWLSKRNTFKVSSVPVRFNCPKTTVPVPFGASVLQKTLAHFKYRSASAKSIGVPTMSEPFGFPIVYWMTLLVGLMTVLPLALEPADTLMSPLTTKDGSVLAGGSGVMFAPMP